MDEQIQQAPKKLSTGSMVAVAVVLAIAIGGGTYAFANNKAQKEKTDLQAQITELQNQIDETTAKTTSAPTSTTTSPTAATDETVDWKTYTNDKYGFTLTFTNKWQGYRVVEKTDPESAEVSYRVFVPTSEKQWSDPALGEGYAGPFVISLFKTSVWDDLEAKSNADNPIAIYGSVVTKNTDYVAVVAYWQDSPADLRASGLADEAKSVAQSFKFTN